jgi:hypothetical protein
MNRCWWLVVPWRDRLQCLRIMMLVCKDGEVVYQCLAIIHALVPDSCMYQRFPSLIVSSDFERKLFPIERAVALALTRLSRGCAVVNPPQIFSGTSDLRAPLRLRLQRMRRVLESKTNTRNIFSRAISVLEAQHERVCFRIRYSRSR